MITFERHGETVRLKVNLYIPLVGHTWYAFDWYCGADKKEYAGLLADAMDTAMNKKRSEELTDAYNAGYKDGRAKRAKANRY
jgi:hypothetical protein